jgi:hypothetical protein
MTTPGDRTVSRVIRCGRKPLRRERAYAAAPLRIEHPDTERLAGTDRVAEPLLGVEVERHRDPALVAQPLGLIVGRPTDGGHGYVVLGETRGRAVERDEPLLAGQAPEVPHQLDDGEAVVEHRGQRPRLTVRSEQRQVGRDGLDVGRHGQLSVVGW